MLHKLPMQLGWGLALLAFVGSLGISFMSDADADFLEMLAQACMWAGLASVFGAVMGYMVFLALGGHDQDEEPEGEDSDIAVGGPSMAGSTGRLVDLTAGDDDLDDLEESPSELDEFSAEEISRAVQTQLRADEDDT